MVYSPAVSEVFPNGLSKVPEWFTGRFKASALNYLYLYSSAKDEIVNDVLGNQEIRR